MEAAIQLKYKLVLNNYLYSQEQQPEMQLLQEE